MRHDLSIFCLFIFNPAGAVSFGEDDGRDILNFRSLEVRKLGKAVNNFVPDEFRALAAQFSNSAGLCNPLSQGNRVYDFTRSLQESKARCEKESFKIGVPS